MAARKALREFVASVRPAPLKISWAEAGFAFSKRLASPRAIRPVKRLVCMVFFSLWMFPASPLRKSQEDVTQPEYRTGLNKLLQALTGALQLEQICPNPCL